MQNKTCQVIVRMTRAAKQHLYAQAELAGMSANSFMTSLILGVDIKPANTELIHQVVKIGTNINQIAKHANMSGNISPTQIDAIIDYQRLLLARVKNYGSN